MQRQVKTPHENLTNVANYHCMQLKYIARIAFTAYGQSNCLQVCKLFDLSGKDQCWAQATNLELVACCIAYGCN